MNDFADVCEIIKFLKDDNGYNNANKHAISAILEREDPHIGSCTFG